MDIQAEWKHLMGRNAMEIMSWTTDFMNQFWRLDEEDAPPREERRRILDEYRRNVMNEDYDWLIGASAELIREHTNIKLDNSYLARSYDSRSVDDPDFVGDY